MPPVWNQRGAFRRRRWRSQSMSPGRSWLTAVWPRSEHADRAAHAEAALGEVEPVARPSGRRRRRAPSGRASRSTPPWQDQVLDQAADRVVGERGDDGRAQAEAAPQRRARRCTRRRPPRRGTRASCGCAPRRGRAAASPRRATRGPSARHPRGLIAGRLMPAAPALPGRDAVALRARRTIAAASAARPLIVSHSPAATTSWVASQRPARPRRRRERRGTRRQARRRDPARRHEAHHRIRARERAQEREASHRGGREELHQPEAARERLLDLARRARPRAASGCPGPGRGRRPSG